MLCVSNTYLTKIADFFDYSLMNYNNKTKSMLTTIGYNVNIPIFVSFPSYKYNENF